MNSAPMIWSGRTVCIRGKMLTFAFSAAVIGAVHSFSPGHWLPVVLLAKARKWGLARAMAGASITALGHVVSSGVMGVVVVAAGLNLITQFEESVEKYGALGLILFGISYAVYSYFYHSQCVGHTHHGPNPRKTRMPVLFLFGIGLSPCMAALPLFVASSGSGGLLQMMLTLAAFAGGVLIALLSATLLFSKGLMKLDHPIFEHYGDMLTGLGVSFVGLLLLVLPHGH